MKNKNKQIGQIKTWGGYALNGQNYIAILQLAFTEGIRKYSGIGPLNIGNVQCLAGQVGKGKLFFTGDCNGFTAMECRNLTMTGSSLF